MISENATLLHASEVIPDAETSAVPDVPVTDDSENATLSHAPEVIADAETIDTQVQAIRASGLFDEAFYLSMYKDLQPPPHDPIRHYCEYGWREGRNPSGDFDTQFYLDTYSDIRSAGLNPFWHYVVAGAAERRDTRFLDAEVRAIRASGLFDEAFYLSMCGDLQPPPRDPIRHYCEHGWREGRNPSRDFDTRSYLETYTDIRSAGLNPFLHYVAAGAVEGRDAYPGKFLDAEVQAIRASGLFDEAFYLSMYHDLPPMLRDPIRHYCQHGWREGRNPSDDFDTRFYLDTYSDIRDAGLNPFWHYVVAGAAEGRDAWSDMSARYEDQIGFGSVATDVRLLAFYASPKWDAVRGGRPRFMGHYQPMLPCEELGTYDPSDWRVLRHQAHMASRHGIYGFCFDLNFVSGTAVELQPIGQLLAHDEIEIRFCAQITISSKCLLDLAADFAGADLGGSASNPRRRSGRPSCQGSGTVGGRICLPGSIATTTRPAWR